MRIHAPYSLPPRAPATDAASVRDKADAVHTPAGDAETARVERADATPALWDLLTAEEREFFSQHLSIGPLTYRPGGAPRDAQQAPTGQRIDVKG